MTEEELARVRQLCADYMRLAHRFDGRDAPDYDRLPEIEGLLASFAPALLHEIDMMRASNHIDYDWHLYDHAE